MKTLFPYSLSKLLLKSVLICSSIVLLCLFWSIGGKNITWCQSPESEEIPTKETYVSEIIIQAPWGEKSLYTEAEESLPGEFGMHEEFQEPEAEGGLIIWPNSLSVAPNGDIYISDPLNKRVQRFSPGGAFVSVIPINAGLICVDNQNNIYTTRSGRPLWYIDKYDQSGNLLQSYPIDIYSKRKISDDWIESRGLGGLYCDNSGNVFIAFRYDFRKLDRVAKAFLDSSWGGICQVGAAANAFSLEEQKNYTIREGFLGANSSALAQGYFIGGGGRLHLVSFQGDTIRTYHSIRGSFMGCDQEGNVYTQESNLHVYGNEDRETLAPLVRKYNPKGELVASFKYWCEKPYYGSITFLDNKGNLYLLCQSFEDGIKVIKWYKAN
jgi:hypothetical protein